MSVKITQDTTGFDTTDWDNIREMVAGTNDPYGVTKEEVSRAQNGGSYFFKDTRDDVDRAIAAYKNSQTYKDRRASRTATETQQVVSDEIKSYQSPEFKFDPNSQFLIQQRRIIEGQTRDAGRDLQKQLASRGLTDSGMLSRSLAKLYGQKQAATQQVTAQEYLRQLDETTKDDALKFSRMLQKYNVSTQDYNTYMDNFYKNQAILQQQALNRWMQDPVKIGIDIGTAILKEAAGTAAKAVTAGLMPTG